MDDPAYNGNQGRHAPSCRARWRQRGDPDRRRRVERAGLQPRRFGDVLGRHHPRSGVGIRLRRRVGDTAQRAGLPRLLHAARSARRGLRRRNRLLLGGVRLWMGGAAGHTRGRRRSHHRAPGREAVDARVRRQRPRHLVPHVDQHRRFRAARPRPAVGRRRCSRWRPA